MALVEVVGVGFVGLTTAVIAAQAGHAVIGIERDCHRLEALRSGRLPFAEPNLEKEMQAEISRGTLSFVGFDYKGRGEAILVVAAPTPTLASGESDTSIVLECVTSFYERDRHALVLIRSTLIPGSIERMLDGAPTHLGDRLAHWPEFMNQGKALEESRRPDRVVMGATSRAAGDAAYKFIRSMDIEHTKYHRLSITAAEASKHFSNAALAVNQVLGAEIAAYCESMKIDASAVLASVSADSRLNPVLLRPRVPLVDSCLAKDLRALTTRIGSKTDSGVLEATLTTAERLRVEAVQRLVRHADLAGSDATILILGAGFSPGVSDTNQSLVWELLAGLDGRSVRVWDPYVDATTSARIGSILSSDDLCDSIREADVVAVVVAHPELNFAFWKSLRLDMLRNATTIVDYCDLFGGASYQPEDWELLVHAFGNTRECVACAG